MTAGEARKRSLYSGDGLAHMEARLCQLGRMYASCFVLATLALFAFQVHGTSYYRMSPFGLNCHDACHGNTPNGIVPLQYCAKEIRHIMPALESRPACDDFDVTENKTLEPGDLAVVSFQAAAEHEQFGILVLRPEGLMEGTAFYVTDNGLDDECTLRDNEGILKFTAPVNVPPYEVITFKYDDGNLTDGWERYRGAFNLRLHGDQLFIFDYNSDLSIKMISALQSIAYWKKYGESVTSSNSAIPTVCPGFSQEYVLAVGARPAEDDEATCGHPHCPAKALQFQGCATCASMDELKVAVFDPARWLALDKARDLSEVPESFGCKIEEANGCHGSTSVRRHPMTKEFDCMHAYDMSTDSACCHCQVNPNPSHLRRLSVPEPPSPTCPYAVVTEASQLQKVIDSAEAHEPCYIGINSSMWFYETIIVPKDTFIEFQCVQEFMCVLNFMDEQQHIQVLGNAVFSGIDFFMVPGISDPYLLTTAGGCTRVTETYASFYDCRWDFCIAAVGGGVALEFAVANFFNSVFLRCEARYGGALAASNSYIQMIHKTRFTENLFFCVL